ncbi:hypothetical protein ACP70R_038267 [Stipagrostis hirtigluma subsp. patula]
MCFRYKGQRLYLGYGIDHSSATEEQGGSDGVSFGRHNTAL